MAYIVFEGPEEERNMNTLVEMINSMEVREDDETFKNAVDYMFDGLERRSPQHFAVRQYKKYKLASGKTAKSILISCGARLAPFDIPQLREIMSFDCSGFVCWVYTASGVRNLPRTTAQGIYNQCAIISPSEAKPGDIIFFTGTYDSPGPVSHVGIYVGDGMMLHCGSPIQYANINSSYWQTHFYAFGRL